MTSNEFRGEKYVAGQDVKEIAVLVRHDIKEAVRAGCLPATSYRVTIQRFSGGQSLSVKLGVVHFDIREPSFVMADQRVHFEGERYTALARLTIKRVEDIVRAYNRDNSDIASDYFNVAFYENVDWSSESINNDHQRIARREGATGCTYCLQRGCLDCAPVGYVPPPHVSWHDGREQLELLSTQANPFV